MFPGCICQRGEPTLNDNFHVVTPHHRRRKGARPVELTTAALEIFSANGFASTRLEHVATRAGVSKGTIYLYFDGKEALFKTALEKVFIRAIAALEAIPANGDRAAAIRLRELISGWWQAFGAADLACLPKLIVSESHTFPEMMRSMHEKISGQANAILIPIIDQGIAQGEFRRVDPSSIGRMISDTLFSYVIWQRCFASPSSDIPSAKAFSSTVVDILLVGD